MNRLHYFCTVAQTGSLSRASELLNISQPALSKAIKTLEQEFGERLTIPSGRGIAITDAGRRLVQEAQPLVAAAYSLKERLHSKAHARTIIRLGSFEVFTTYFLTKILSGPLNEASLDVSELVPGEIEKALLDHKIDIGLTYLPIPAPELDLIKITTIKMAAYRKKGAFGDLPFDQMPFACPNIPVTGTPSKVKGLDGWPDDRHPRRILHRVAMMEGALELCRQGFAIGYFPKFVVDMHNAQVKNPFHLEEVAIPKEYKVKEKQDVFLVKRKTDYESVEFRKLANEVRKLS